MNEWLENTPYTLISDHGVSIRKKRQTWKTLEYLRTDWMEDVLPVFETFVDRTSGTLLEEKEFSLAWRYRDIDVKLAQKRVVEIKMMLTSFISSTDLTLLESNKVIEIKSSKVNKDRACNYVLDQNPTQHVFAIGDDWTDEFMFEELPKDSQTIKVGVEETKAKFYVANLENVRNLLKQLANNN